MAGIDCKNASLLSAVVALLKRFESDPDVKAAVRDLKVLQADVSKVTQPGPPQTKPIDWVSAHPRLSAVEFE
ncbi:MAG: hypothetical protein QM796_18985 [Chthoniobacteraceae bacterium]